MASKKKQGARFKINLTCSECKRKNYTTMKNKKNTPDKIALSKFCPACKKHVEHKESKI